MAVLEPHSVVTELLGLKLRPLSSVPCQQPRWGPSKSLYTWVIELALLLVKSLSNSDGRNPKAAALNVSSNHLTAQVLRVFLPATEVLAWIMLESAEGSALEVLFNLSGKVLCKVLGHMLRSYCCTWLTTWKMPRLPFP